jgi:hypothetical protein
MSDYELRVQLTVQAPPAGVAWALQVGRDEIVPPVKRAGSLEFAATLRVVTDKDGALDFRGSVVQGPKRGRFVYLTSGVRAGQAGSRWDRRAKVTLEPLREMLSKRSVSAKPPAAASVAISGTGRDGGPACASVPLLDNGWRLEGAGGRA